MLLSVGNREKIVNSSQKKNNSESNVNGFGKHIKLDNATDLTASNYKVIHLENNNASIFNRN